MEDSGTPPQDAHALLELARSVALEAADLVRTRRKQGVEVTATKSSPIDIVTEVDGAAEKLIYQRLMQARPEDGFLGEEGSSARSASGVRWIVDPIDGTVNFLYGIPQYAVSIAAARDDAAPAGRSGGGPASAGLLEEVVAGVVVNVASGEVFSATRGGGAFADGAPLAVRPEAPLSQRLVVTGFNYVADVRAKQAAAAARMLAEVRDIRRLGSAALDLCAVGAGRADAYVEEGLKPWDMAAGALVATEAGAKVEVTTGVGGTDLVLCAPREGFAAMRSLAERCGFFAQG